LKNGFDIPNVKKTVIQTDYGKTFLDRNRGYFYRLPVRFMMRKVQYMIFGMLIFGVSVINAAVDDYDVFKSAVVAKYNSIKPAAWGMYIPGVKTHIKTDQKIIALTFDACGGSAGRQYDKDLINYLIAENIPATLFVTSSWISHNESVFDELRKNPLFELENHGLNHRPASVMGKLAWGIKGTESVAACFDEVEKSAREFARRTGHRPRYYRAGTAHYDDVAVKIIQETGQSPMNFSGVIGDADKILALPRVITFIRRNVHCGAVMIMHFNHPGGKTLPALKVTIPEMRAKGYSFVRLSDYPDRVE
jgi:peptidoglycan/xylan/chitin deacetylase (PgdA/CDA1 family)